MFKDNNNNNNREKKSAHSKKVNIAVGIGTTIDCCVSIYLPYLLKVSSQLSKVEEKPVGPCTYNAGAVLAQMGG